MSCNHCNTKFNFFHKEIPCSNCGLSFCNKCLKQKCKIPNKGSSDQNVCRLCFNKLTSSLTSSSISITNNTSMPPPPDIFLKRLENLENPAAPPIVMYKHNKKIAALRTGLSIDDQKLLDRLEKLKEDSKHIPPTESELRKRLANLKGENDYVEGPSKSIYQLDTRTDQQKADSLLEQFNREREIELVHNPQSEIELRLATLREQGIRPNEGPYISNLHDSGSSEDEVEKITKKIMDEVALDDKNSLIKKFTPSSSNDNDNDDEDDEFVQKSPELPWCVLCNNDAKFKCLDCSGDLYCAECNREVHQNMGETDHRVIPYKSK